MARRKRKSEGVREHFLPTGRGEYHHVAGYSYVRKAQTITRDGKRIHLSRKTIHVKPHLAHNRTRRR